MSDIPSAFELFFTRAIRALVLEMTNLHAERTSYGLRNPWWKAGMGEAELRAYAGLLILAGVYRSRGEAAASLWDAESGRSIFRATMPLKAFYAYSTLLRFDDRETRAQRRSSDKLAAVRELWDRWADRLPYMYNPGPDVTVDEQLVPFRGTWWWYRANRVARLLACIGCLGGFFSFYVCYEKEGTRNT